MVRLAVEWDAFQWLLFAALKAAWILYWTWAS